MVVVGSYCPRLASLPAITRLANSAKVWRFRTCGRLYFCDTLLQRLSPHFEPVVCALGPRFQAAPAGVGPRHLTGQRDAAAPDF
jgi:hypothetical protein